MRIRILLLKDQNHCHEREKEKNGFARARMSKNATKFSYPFQDDFKKKKIGIGLVTVNLCFSELRHPVKNL